MDTDDFKAEIGYCNGESIGQINYSKTHIYFDGGMKTKRGCTDEE